MSSSTLPTQELQGAPFEVVSSSQSTELKVGIAVSGQPSSDTIPQKLGDGSLSSSTAATTPSSASSSCGVVLAASNAGPLPPSVTVPPSPAGPLPSSVTMSASPAGLLPPSIAVPPSPAGLLPPSVTVPASPAGTHPPSIAAPPSPAGPLPPSISAPPSPAGSLPPSIAASPSPAGPLPRSVAASPSPAGPLPPSVAASPSPAGLLPPSVAASPSPAGPLPPTVAASPSPAGQLPPSVAAAPSPAVPLPPRFPGNNAAQESIRANFSNNPGYTVPAGFSYSVFPRVNHPSGALQQRPMPPAGNLSNRISPAALQPPVPGQPIVSRPSFSYNIVSHANSIPAPGQQFQPTAVPGQILNQTRPQGDINPSQSSVPSSHSSPSVQPLGSNSNITRDVPENPPTSSQLSCSLEKGQPSAPSFSIGVNSQPSAPSFSVGVNSHPSTMEEKEASSTAVTESTIQSTPAWLSSVKSEQSCASTSSCSTPALGTSTDLNHTSSLTPGGYPGMFGPKALPPSGLLSSTVTVRPTVPEAFGMPQKTARPSAPSNSASFQTPTMHNIPPQLNHPRPLYPVAAPPQPVWLSPQVGGIQRPPFLPYSGATPAPYPLPMRGTPPITALHPPGVPIMGPSGVSPSITAGSVPSSSISMTKSSPPDSDKQLGNLVHNDSPKKIDADAWTAHKTEEGVIYYYNSVTGESTYEKPENFKADKVTAQPTPISWEKLPGSDWALVATDDGKTYYYNMKNKASSWQIPQEVADLLKNQENTAPVSIASPSQSVDKVASATLNTPALQTGSRDAVGLRTSVGAVSSSALDLVKKKLQDASVPISSPPIPVSSVLVGSTSESVKAVESCAPESESSKEKPKDTNGDANLSESSSDSEDVDGGPTKEECIIQFKEMLKERGIAPFSKWEKELPKILFDPRFKAVPGFSLRRSVFEHYVRTRAEEERKEKKAALKSAIGAFKSLLDEASEDIDVRTDYATFKRKWGNDRRFVGLDRKEKEQLLNERILSLKKAAEETRAVAVSKFKSMLRERRDISSTTRWSRVKDSLRNDPRYKVAKHDEREALFNEYLLELKAVEDDVEKAEKYKREEQEKLKRREQETRKRKQREEQEMETLKLKVRRKESEASFQALLVETIKDSKASWTESKPKLEKDPQRRFTNSGLELADMEKLFREHVKLLFERCVNDFRALLNDAIPVEASSKVSDNGKSILTSWSEAKVLLKADVRYSKLPSKDKESLWRKHVDEMLRKQKGTSNSTRSDPEGKTKSSSGILRHRRL